MASAPEIIEVSEAESELARLFEKALDHPLVLERKGVRVRMEREFVYDAQAAREAMEKAGTLVGVDSEELIQRLYRAQEEGSGVPSDP